MTTPRPPAPLPRPARALLASYRDAHEIPNAAKDRIWSVVGAEDAPAPAYDPLDDPRDGVEPPQRGSFGNVRWLAWGTATLAAAAVLVLAWQLGGTLAERRQATRTPGAAVMQGGGGSPQGRASAGAREPAEAHRAAPPPAPRAPLAPDSDPDPSPAVESEARDPAGAAARSRSSTSGDPTSGDPNSGDPASGDPASSKPEPSHSSRDRTVTEPGSTLAAERELVARAWRALALGETASALDAAAEHARRFPAGLLVPERVAIDTIARCRRGDADGPRRATAFHHAYAGSPLAKRVDEACVAPPRKE